MSPSMLMLTVYLGIASFAGVLVSVFIPLLHRAGMDYVDSSQEYYRQNTTTPRSYAELIR